MQNVIEAVTPKGDVVFCVPDGSYVVAQQINAKPLKPAQILEGALDNIGIKSVWEPSTGTTDRFFIAAYGLSREGVLRTSFDGNFLPEAIAYGNAFKEWIYLQKDTNGNFVYEVRQLFRTTANTAAAAL